MQQQLDDAVGRSLPLEATDHLGVVSRLWPVTDQQVVSAVTGLMGPKPIFIADGHHRYETALRYLEERREAGEVPRRRGGAELHPDDAGEHERPRPGHPADAPARLRHSRPDGRAAAPRCSSRISRCETVGQGEKGAARETWELMEADGGQNVLGFGTVADGVWQTARFRSPQLMAELAAAAQPGLAGAGGEHPARRRAGDCCRQPIRCNRLAVSALGDLSHRRRILLGLI